MNESTRSERSWMPFEIIDDILRMLHVCNCSFRALTRDIEDPRKRRLWSRMLQRLARHGVIVFDRDRRRWGRSRRRRS